MKELFQIKWLQIKGLRVSYKSAVWIIFAITLFSLAQITYQAVYETDNWAWFELDYTNKAHIIASYGTLIGGILAFLSVLFILYQVLQQREQIEREKIEAHNRQLKEYENLMRVLSGFLGTIIKDVKSQGDSLTEFYQAEFKNPTLSNQAYFTVNRNFNRIIEMDYNLIYKSFQNYFNYQSDWEKDFLLLYRNIDFYKDVTPHLRENYRSQILEKTQQKYKIQKHIDNLLQNWNNLRNQYLSEFPRVFNADYFLWFQSLNKHFILYRQYVDYIEYRSAENNRNPTVEAKPMDSDLTDLRTTYFEPFFQEMLNLKKQGLPEVFEETKLIEDLGRLITSIKKMESFAINYARDVRKNVNAYYTDENEHLKELEAIKDRIDFTLQEQSKYGRG